MADYHSPSFTDGFYIGLFTEFKAQTLLAHDLTSCSEPYFTMLIFHVKSVTIQANSFFFRLLELSLCSTFGDRGGNDDRRLKCFLDALYPRRRKRQRSPHRIHVPVSDSVRPRCRYENHIIRHPHRRVA